MSSVNSRKEVGLNDCAKSNEFYYVGAIAVKVELAINNP